MVSKSFSLLRLNTLQRLVVLLLAVTGILVGLLAMHTLTAVVGDHSAHHVSALADQEDTMSAPVAGADTAAPASSSGLAHSGADCNGTCESGHNMADMVCLLALLVLTLVLTLRVIITRRGNDLHRLVAALAAAHPAAPAPPSPPSLLVLSISRT
ncbi:hypothetical protein LSHI6S_03078 [Leifsonia shinshuensis]